MDDTQPRKSRTLTLTLLAVMLAGFSLDEGLAHAEDTTPLEQVSPQSPPEADAALTATVDDAFAARWDAELRKACWTLVESEITDGVRAGVRDSGRALSPADREDATSIALTKAWSKLGVEHLEKAGAWARVIGRNTARDMLRRRNTDPLFSADRDEEDAPLAGILVDTETPEDALRDAQLSSLHAHVATWPREEALLARAFLEGEADSISGAAHWARDTLEAQGTSVSMYPAKARLLLQARRGELGALWETVS